MLQVMKEKTSSSSSPTCSESNAKMNSDQSEEPTDLTPEVQQMKNEDKNDSKEVNNATLNNEQPNEKHTCSSEGSK